MKNNHASKTFTASTLTSLLLLSVAQPAGAVTVSQQPLFLTEGVAPNLLVTLDDSGSMAFAYAPDSISGDASNSTNSGSKKRFLSSYYNPMYYNPSVTYRAPKKITYNSGNGLIEVTEYSTTYTKAWIHGYRTTLGNLDLSKDYLPTEDYTSGSTSQTYASHPFKVTTSNSSYRNGAPAYYYTFKTSLSGCDGSNSDEDCYEKVNVSTSEQQNFANWYSFYRTRALATQSAANLAFYTLPDNVRVSWQMLNTCTDIGQASSSNANCKDKSGNSYNNGLKVFANQHRQNFFDWLSDTPASGGTPLRTALQRAGEFLKRTNLGARGAYAQDPGVSVGTLYACRPSYQILMTDGLWNTDSVNVSNYDSTGHTLPDGTSYSSRAPYQDSASNTLADLAFKYWAEDLQPSIDNKLSPYVPYTGTDSYWNPRNDPATWQHMTTFTLGLGLTRQLVNPAWGTNTFDGDYPKLLAGTKTWPSASDNSSQNVYDLWHAAINSRGEFFSVDSPDAMVSAFETILSRIADRESSAAAVSLESAVSRSGNEAYYARFSSNPWYGELVKFDVDANGGLAQAWNARSLLAAKTWTSRTIKMKGTGTSGLADFTWANLSTAQKALLNVNKAGTTDNLGSARVDYIKGSQAKAGTDFFDRQQANILGDIVHSSPVVVGAPDRLPALMDAIGDTSGASNSYAQFATTQASRAKRIYVGANDGMLHGFDNDGQEVFAYVPTAVLPKLNHLTDKAYSGANHQYYVDGTPVVGDVVINGQWRTILVGTLGGGGRSMFALDITNPSSISLLWEFSSSDDGDLGFSFGKPIITRLHSGGWGVLMSNGYSSTNERAALFVLNAANGSVLKKLTVDTGTAGNSVANGLSTPKAVDINGDLVTDYVYAGDLQGNMWRFDLFTANTTPAFSNATNTAASAFRIAFGGKPLYKAQTVAAENQPITAAPTIVRHPTGVGYIVNFGTGKYIESSDSGADISKAMSLYGIWDTQLDGTSASALQGGSALARSKLVQQAYSTAANATFTDAATNTSKNRDYRVLSRNAIQWYTGNNPASGINKYGWYLDLTNGNTLEGELVATDLSERAGILLGTSTIPNQDPCTSGIDRWFFAIDATTGGATTFNVLDTTGNNYVDANDSANGQVVSGIKIPGFGAPGIVGNDVFFNTDGGVQRERIDYGDQATGRQNWRIIEE